MQTAKYWRGVHFDWTRTTYGTGGPRRERRCRRTVEPRDEVPPSHQPDREERDRRTFPAHASTCTAAIARRPLPRRRGSARPAADRLAVVDATGKVVATSVIYPHEPQRRWDEALTILGKLAKPHKVELISICNGTASREADKLATELMCRRNCPTSMCHCAVQCRSRAGCRIACRIVLREDWLVMVL